MHRCVPKERGQKSSQKEHFKDAVGCKVKLHSWPHSIFFLWLLDWQGLKRQLAGPDKGEAFQKESQYNDVVDQGFNMP